LRCKPPSPGACSPIATVSMAPASEADKAKELKEKLKQAKEKAGSHKARKDPKTIAREKVEAEAKAKEVKEAKAKQSGRAAPKPSSKPLSEVERAMRAPTPARAPEPPPRPDVWASPGEEVTEIGLHLGVSCDGCGAPPPLVGRVMKCKDCPDFDLCEECFPERKDRARAEVAAKMGVPGGKHPAHNFGARRAGSVMTREACEKELVAMAADAEKRAAFSAAAPGYDVDPRLARRTGVAADLEVQAWRPDWVPSAGAAADCPLPGGRPMSLGPGLSEQAPAVVRRG